MYLWWNNKVLNESSVKLVAQITVILWRDEYNTGGHTSYKAYVLLHIS